MPTAYSPVVHVQAMPHLCSISAGGTLESAFGPERLSRCSDSTSDPQRELPGQVGGRPSSGTTAAFLAPLSWEELVLTSGLPLKVGPTH